MSRKGYAIATLLLGLVLAGSFFEPAKAVPAMGWASDARVPGYLDDTFTPILVADQNRTVHAFASQWVENEGRKRAIVYREWTKEGGWTRPVDIILASKGDAVVLGAFLDGFDRMHLILTYQQDNTPELFYSSALVREAASAGAWSPPVMLGRPVALESAAITGDAQGHLMVIYSGNASGSGVYAVNSSDSGMNWSKQAPVYLTNDPDLVPNTLRLVSGRNGRVSATWNVVTSLGVDKMLYYAGYDVQKAAWTDPIQLDKKVEIQDYFGPSYPAIVDNGAQIVIMYNGGNPLSGRPVGTGRPVQQVFLSNDGGNTWNGPAVPFLYHLGRSGEHALVLDSAEVPHALFVQRIESSNEQGQYVATGGVWHSAFTGNTWTNPERYVTTYTPHDLHAVVSQGNVLLVVWREDPGIGKHGIWFSYLVLDAPELSVVALATAALAAPVTATMTPVLIGETATPISQDSLEGASPSNWQTNPGFPLIAGILPVVLIVIGAVIAIRILPNQHE